MDLNIDLIRSELEIDKDTLIFVNNKEINYDVREMKSGENWNLSGVNKMSSDTFTNEKVHHNSKVMEDKKPSQLCLKISNVPMKPFKYSKTPHENININTYIKPSRFTNKTNKLHDNLKNTRFFSKKISKKLDNGGAKTDRGKKEERLKINVNPTKNRSLERKSNFTIRKFIGTGLNSKEKRLKLRIKITDSSKEKGKISSRNRSQNNKSTKTETGGKGRFKHASNCKTRVDFVVKLGGGDGRKDRNERMKSSLSKHQESVQNKNGVSKDSKNKSLSKGKYSEDKSQNLNKGNVRYKNNNVNNINTKIATELNNKKNKKNNPNKINATRIKISPGKYFKADFTNNK